jgi:hypothetical protein
VAAGGGPVAAATADDAAAALIRMREVIDTDADAAVVVVSCPDAGLPGIDVAWQELLRRARSVIVLDRPIPNEFAAAVIGPGYGYAVCARAADPLDLVTLHDLPSVAAVTRRLLALHGS